jgi:hypothetical protein
LEKKKLSFSEAHSPLHQGKFKANYLFSLDAELQLFLSTHAQIVPFSKLIVSINVCEYQWTRGSNIDYSKCQWFNLNFKMLLNATSGLSVK